MSNHHIQNRQVLMTMHVTELVAPLNEYGSHRTHGNHVLRSIRFGTRANVWQIKHSCNLQVTRNHLFRRWPHLNNLVF